MPEQDFSRKTPSVAGLMQKRAAEEAVQEAERAAQQSALHVVDRWSTERSPLWSPAIRYAVVAETPWLDVYCPGCQTGWWRLGTTDDPSTGLPVSSDERRDIT